MAFSSMRNVVVLAFILSLGQRSGGQECYNGREERRSDNSTSCDCFLGWTGEQCQHCDGRIRLNSSGVVRDHYGGSVYTSESKCVFFIEADSPAASIHLRVNFFQMECQWDYLYIYDGDSVFSPKLAAFTGNLLEQPDDGLPLLPKPIPNIAISNSSNMSSGSGSGSGSGEPDVNEPEPYQEPLEVTLSSSGPHLLMYFYTDRSAVDLGFEFSYWLTYECPDNCSGRGMCDDNGTCSCFTGWAGQFCQLSVCPNDCFNNGICNDSIGECQCYDGFTGTDCSASVESPRWMIVDYTVTPEGSLPPSVIARAGHSAVVWREYMVVYGGYQFPSGDMPEEENEWQLLRYRFSTKELERLVLNDTQLPELPGLRYGHSAVVYEDKMYIFGGSKFPTEEITNELWSLDLMTLTWTNLSPVDNSSDSVNGSSVDGGDVVSMVDSSPSRDVCLPIAVRSHTAHVVGSKMVVFFGLSQGELPFVPFVQEYDFVTGNWTTPSQYGFKPVGRIGHSSVYSPETGLIYVYGGREGGNLLDQVLVYDPITYTWNKLTGSGAPHYFHSATIYGSLMLTFGGCDRVGGREDCFSKDFFVYNIACDSWYLGSEYTGLPGNSSRYGHSSVLDPSDSSLLVFGGFLGTLHHDILRLYTGNCSAFTTQEDCLNGSALCAWSTDDSQCVPAVEGGGDLVYNCTVDPCRGYRSCGECNDHRDEGCKWDGTSFSCVTTVEDVQPATCPSGDSCDRYSTCGSCFSHGCSWNEECVSEQTFNDTCPLSTPCSSHTSCDGCTAKSCLWCPALNQCLSPGTYPVMYPYGQCLGWVETKDTCPGECSSLQTCSSCEEVVDCGWCNDPSNTGLGTCAEGGFLGSRNDTACQEESWYYYQCPACQCNGHSVCVNDSSVCEQCQNNTVGDKCQECAYAYFGNAANGGTCHECNCNGYNPTCETRNGTCNCLDMGVSGNYCTSCNLPEGYTGDADNFCYYPLQVGFIYTFEVQSPSDRQSFYTATPGEDKELNFEFKISHNPQHQTIEIQLFLGRESQNLWVLRNLTDPISLGGESSYKKKLDDFGSTKSANKSQLFSFTRPLIRTWTNFTSIFDTASENDYTRHMWNDDVTLIVFVSNLTNPMTFKITVDQMDLIFLLYFFATFITCFTILLAAFLGGWYIKRKLAHRSMMRQQVIELQRRVSRGFARIKVIVDKKPHYEVPQTPTYTGVEALKNNKAAVLTVFVRLPGDSSTGRPAPGRTGLCCGSTLVRLNPSKSSRSKEARRRGRERSISAAVSPSTAEV